MKKILFAMLFAGFVATSCEHKELCFDHRHCRIPVSVVFDWRNAPSADPESMSLFLFPKDGGEPLRYEFAGRDGGEIAIPVGRYDAVCVNSDTESAYFRNMNRLETFEVRTREIELFAGLDIRSEGAPRAEGTETEEIVFAPEMMWAARSFDLDFSLCDSESSDDAPRSIVFYPAEIVCHYSVEIRNADNLKYISALSGSLSGMSGGSMLASDTPTAECVTLPFAASSDGESIVGSWLTFGHCPASIESSSATAPYPCRAAHKLVIYAVLTDGTKWYYTYDVTDSIRTAADPRHVHIVLDGLPLPEPSGSGGFRPEVGDWNVVHIDIEL